MFRSNPQKPPVNGNRHVVAQVTLEEADEIRRQILHIHSRRDIYIHDGRYVFRKLARPRSPKRKSGRRRGTGLRKLFELLGRFNFVDRTPRCAICKDSATHAIIYRHEIEPGQLSHHSIAWFANWQQLTVDHIRPVSKGGTNDVGNMQLACARCNREKADSFSLIER